MEKCPIVVFGDEGGIHVVANSFKELLQLLSLDREISVSYEDVYFYKDEDEYCESDYHDEYIQWLKDEFGLDPLNTDDECNAIIKNAQDKHQESLHAFLEKFGIEF